MINEARDVLEKYMTEQEKKIHHWSFKYGNNQWRLEMGLEKTSNKEVRCPFCGSSHIRFKMVILKGDRLTNNSPFPHYCINCGTEFGYNNNENEKINSRRL